MTKSERSEPILEIEAQTAKPQAPFHLIDGIIFLCRGEKMALQKGIWIQQLLSKAISYFTIHTKQLPHLSNVGQLIASEKQQGFFLF